MDNGALRPTTINDFIHKTENKTDVEALTEEEKILAAGAPNAFWKTLKRHFEDSMVQLDQLNENAMAGGMSFEEIGRNALVINQVKGVLRRIINVVEDSAQAVEAQQVKETDGGKQ